MYAVIHRWLTIDSHISVQCVYTLVGLCLTADAHPIRPAPLPPGVVHKLYCSTMPFSHRFSYTSYDFTVAQRGVHNYGV